MNFKKFFSILAFIFSLSFVFSEEESVIKIEKAQKTEYKKDSETKEESIILIGDVKVSITQNSKTVIITADRINFNRAKNILFAEGNVVVEQKNFESSDGELVFSNSLMFNTLTLEGIFDNGKAIQSSSDSIKLPSGSKLIVDSNVFGRDSDGTITFKSGNLTFCDDENPHWRIRATRIWLLPGNEFAFFNAVLFVGHIPLLWLPLFYYPKDELVFNPVFGYKKRTGYFFNTTTYLYGRKSNNSISKTDNSEEEDKVDFFDFINTGVLKEQRREGLVLHNLNKNYTGDTVNYFKIMVDYYENLGIMFGYDTKLSPNDYLKKFESNLEIAFSNTVYKFDTFYSPYNKVGEKTKDYANFLNFETPFRYQANIKMVFEKPFSLALSLPIYSDPFYYYDFYNRVETMDWIDYAMNGGKTYEYNDESKVKDEDKEISRFTWSLDGNYSIPISDNAKPYINKIDLTNFYSSIVYDSKQNTKLSDRKEYKDDYNWEKHTPERKFYYPSLVTPLKFSGKVSGNIIKIPQENFNTKNINLTISKPDDLKIEENTDVQKKEILKSKEDIIFNENLLPELNISRQNNTRVEEKYKKINSGITYNLGYSINPEFLSEISYSAENLYTPKDFDWSDMKSTFVYTKIPTTLSSEVGIKGDFLSLNNSFTFEPVYQTHPYLNNEYYDSNSGQLNSTGKASKNADYNARKIDLINTNSFILKPFTYTEHFSETSINWYSTVKMINTKYVSENPEEPEWEYLTMELWDDDCVTTHNLTASIVAKEYDYSQSLILSSTLPPQIDEYKGKIVFGFPYASFSAESGIKKKNKLEDIWIKEDFSQSFSLNLFSNNIKLEQSYIYDFEEFEPESLRFSLSGYGAQFAYIASYVAGYDFVSGKGWKSKSSDEKYFQPYQLSFAYTNQNKIFKYFSDRIKLSPNLSTSVVYDFLRPTSSYFVFKPGVTFRINNFLDITFSAESRNNSIYKYFCSNDKFNYYYRGVGERNILRDLSKSFSFSNNDDRKSTGFKLKNLNISVTHNLHDWNFNMDFKITPRILTENGKSQYDFSPYMTCSVVWRPMPSIKTEIVDEYGEWKLK